MIEFIDKTETESGTPINRDTMMALQGFIATTTAFNPNGSIVETNAKGETKTTLFASDGSIIEVFVGAKTISKRTFFDPDGTIREVIA